MVTAGDEKQSEGKVYSTIIQQLMHSDLDLSDKTEWSLSEKAFTIVAAAEVTTARVMEVTLFNVLNDPDALSKLQQELKEAYPDASTLLTHRELERLPYLVSHADFRLLPRQLIIFRLPVLWNLNGRHSLGL